MKKIIPKIKVWFSTEDSEGFFGEGKCRLLREIKSSGSLSAAAEKLNISYRKAWGDLKKAEQGFGVKLIETTRGGQGGGRTLITKEGEKLLEKYTEFKSEVKGNTNPNLCLNLNPSPNPCLNLCLNLNPSPNPCLNLCLNQNPSPNPCPNLCLNQNPSPNPCPNPNLSINPNQTPSASSNPTIPSNLNLNKTKDMKKKFNHEQLSVYQKSIAFVASLNNVINSKQHPFAVYDQIHRASESIVMNLVQANSMPLSDSRLNRLDYSLGSTFECAACIDILKIWELISDDHQKSLKTQLQTICKMLIGLKKNVHKAPQVNEQENEYGSTNNNVFFHHEKMQVYMKSIEYICLLKSIFQLQQMSYNNFRSLDKYSVSIILNIAEGNGRYSFLDHRRFLSIAMTATLKSSASLDLIVAKNIISNISVEKEKQCLKEIYSMLFKLDEYWGRMKDERKERLGEENLD